MEWSELSPEGKRRFVRWLEKQRKNHVHMCISKMVSGAKDEQDLFNTCRRINRAIKILREDAQTSQEVQTEDLGPDASDDFDGSSPETFRTVCMDDDSAQAPVVENIDYRAKHTALLSDTQKKYNAFNTRTKGQINEIIQTHMGVPISQIIMDAENETDVIRMLDEIEGKEVVVNPEVRMYTTRL